MHIPCCFGVVDALKCEEAHIGIRVALAALVPEMAAFDVYCGRQFAVAHEIGVDGSYDGGSSLIPWL